MENKKKRSAKSNKTLGSAIERLYANIFKEMGYSFCTTSRLKSRALDNAKIDLADIPYNVQIKAGKQKSLSPGKVLMLMQMAMKEIFPPTDQVHSKPSFLIHHKVYTPTERMVEGRSSRRTEDESLVYMTLEVFTYFKNKYPHITYLSSKKFKSVPDESPYKEIVCMTFEYLKNNILNYDLQINS